MAGAEYDEFLRLTNGLDVDLDFTATHHVQAPFSSIQVEGRQSRSSPPQRLKGLLDHLPLQITAPQGSKGTPVLHDDHLGPSLSRG